MNHKLKMLDGHIRRRLRVVLLKQWKRRRSIARRLIRLGVQARTAWRVVYEGRKAPWALSHCMPSIMPGSGLLPETRSPLLASSLLGEGPQSSPCPGQGRGRDNCGRHARRPAYGIEFLEPGRPEEPDVRPTSPVL